MKITERREDGRFKIDITMQEFRDIVEAFFKKNACPTADSLKDALVPTGVTRNTAYSGSFGRGGIFKYEFWSSDSQLLIVKFHKPDPYVKARYPRSNSATGWTAQILAGKCEFFGWNNRSKEHKYFIVDAERANRGKAPAVNLAHIPLRSGPERRLKK